MWVGWTRQIASVVVFILVNMFQFLMSGDDQIYYEGSKVKVVLGWEKERMQSFGIFACVREGDKFHVGKETVAVPSTCKSMRGHKRQSYAPAKARLPRDNQHSNSINSMVLTTAHFIISRQS